ncbi:putative metal-dependent hydrolase [Dysgonomonadaceae bacterium PH5-43]|nr:putative metal-dependent hydrolase [Dysgonomonadaceae bacterium PH5-43]
MLRVVDIVKDAELGEVVFRLNTKANNYILKVKSPNITIVTIPYGGNYTIAKNFFNENRDALIQQAKALKVNVEEKLKNKPQYDLNSLIKQANEYLPKEIYRLAMLYNFTYRCVSIKLMKTRWGSCSREKNISLSIYLMLLPKHLIEYVILHELCHTIEMNHSTAFWNLLNKYTNGNAKALRAEIKSLNIIL